MTRRGWMEKMTAVKCRCEMLNWADDDWIKDPIISVILVYKKVRAVQNHAYNVLKLTELSRKSLSDFFQRSTSEIL